MKEWFWPACLALALLCGCGGSDDRRDTTLPELPDQATAEAFNAAVRDGYQALEDGDLEAALVRFRALTDLVPASPLGDFHLACAFGRGGMPSEALEALRRAVGKGYSDREAAAEDPDLSNLYDDPAVEDLLEDMGANRERQRQLLAAGLAAADPSDEPAFPGIDSLKTYYRQLYRDSYRRGRLFPSPLTTIYCGRAVGRELAALERYRATHANPAEHYQAYLAALQAVTRLAGIDSPWTHGRREAQAIAAHICAAYPDSLGAHEAALWDTKAQVYGRALDAAGVIAAEADRAVAEFLDLAGRLPRGEWSAAALAEAIYFRSAITRDVDHLRPLITRFMAESDGNLRGLEHAYLINELALLVNGPAAFTATDIDGREWDLTGLRGKVALLDFWATWCGPCVAEIPTLAALAEEFPPDRFQILGVSLDSANRMTEEALRSWLAEHEMTWPQIFDGQAWSGHLPTLYRIPAIPFPVLLDAEGRVVAAGGSARGDELKRAVRELLGN